MPKVQNPSFISSKSQFFGPPMGYKNAPPKKGIAQMKKTKKTKGAKALTSKMSKSQKSKLKTLGKKKK